MIEPDLRDRILAQPDRILEDRDVMNALVAANDRALGSNIVDLRGIAMQRLESRLDRLEDTHRSVIAAAYENLAGTNQIHRAVLHLLEPTNFEDFMRALSGVVAETLRVDLVRLVLETVQEDGQGDPVLQRLGEVVQVVPRGFVADYLSPGRDAPLRQVLLRPVTSLGATIYHERSDVIRSEALMKLDLGRGRLPSLLVFGSEDFGQFKATHGTDLLTFFAGVFERAMRRWLG